MQMQAIKQQLAVFTKIPVERIKDDAEITDLVADSFMLVEMLLLLQDHFSIELEQEDLEEVVTVAQLVNLVRNKIRAAQPV
ncbi:MAG: acyl carrier protein [Gammaproteobacteria bacterium]|nr:acyl carrier protein [Gammaproteobacteria bacterium]